MLLLTGLSEGLFPFSKSLIVLLLSTGLDNKILSVCPLCKHKFEKKEIKTLDLSENILIRNSKEALASRYQEGVLKIRKLMIGIEIVNER